MSTELPSTPPPTPRDGGDGDGVAGVDRRAGREHAADREHAANGEHAADREHLAAEVTLRANRIRLLSEELRETRAELARVRKEARQATRELAALRRRRVVRLGLAASARIRPIAELARRVRAFFRRDPVEHADPGVAPAAVPALRPLRASRSEEAAFRARLDDALTPSPTTSGPLVSAIVVNRNGVGHLRQLLPAVETVAYQDLEVVLVDNGSTDASVGYVDGLRTRHPIRVVRNEANRSFSVANNQGAAAASGELLLLLNNDVLPAGPHVVGHMVERLLAEPDVGAVAARLIYPRRTGPPTGPATAAADLELQHRGITFVTWDGIPVARNLGAREDPLGADAGARRDVEAATAAALMVRRSAFEAVGGFTLGYDYGFEDVDLSMKLRANGLRIVYEPQATFWHNESATQHREDADGRRIRQRANRAFFSDLWGPRVFREVFLERLAGGGSWADGPLHVGIAITRDDPTAGWGDYYTGHELGSALEAIGWRVSYLERWEDHWYEPDQSVDVVIALLDALDVRRLPEGIVKVAWVRNWTDRWLGQPWFDEYDIVLASSERSKALIDAGSVHVARLMPLATNPSRFRPVNGEGTPMRDPAVAAIDALFVGNHWGHDRQIESVLPGVAAHGRTVALHGRGWHEVPGLASMARGPIAYDDLPAAYASASIVVDDTAGPTLPYAALNSRVFDALAAGTLVVTDNVEGAQELFGGRLPAADTPDGQVRLVEHFLADADARHALTAELRALVLERHTYGHRAEELREALRAWATTPRIDVAIGPPDWDVAESWGDYHFGRGLQRALQRRGHPARLRLRSAWDGPAAARADVMLHVFGLAPCRARRGQLSAVWIISHPDLATDTVVGDKDLVFAASDRYAADLAERLGRDVVALHQATDPARFRPLPGGPEHDLLFVANSRGVRRRIVDELTPTGCDFAVYGRGWTEDLIDPRHVRGEHVPNEELAAYYAAARIVLNDQWPDMAEHGFLSNRLYDASAAGAFVISEHVPGIDEEFDGGVVSFREGPELRALVERFLARPDERAEHARRARAAVLARHTFAHRVDDLLAVVGPLLAQRPLQIGPGVAAGRSAANTAGMAAGITAGITARITPGPAAPPGSPVPPDAAAATRPPA